ncbi:MAG: DUF1326 domain-containing protein [Planctomycetales bacterium]
MKCLRMMLALAVCGCGLTRVGSIGIAGESRISGEYMESRSCDVYTGPCFANGEIGLSGREALMAWKVDEGSWSGVSLNGLTVALAVRASDTLGHNASFQNKPEALNAVVLVDQKADTKQKEALVNFVKGTVPELAKAITKVQSVPMTLVNDHVKGHGVFQAGDVARMETRKVAAGDCICTNEEVFYPPLSKVRNSQPVYCLESKFDSPALGTTWTTYNKRSAFLATFRM